MFCPKIDRFLLRVQVTRAVIVTPTKELAAQTLKNVTELAASCAREIKVGNLKMGSLLECGSWGSLQKCTGIHRKLQEFVGVSEKVRSRLGALTLHAMRSVTTWLYRLASNLS
jgi:phosphoheptose isomerase